MKRKIILDTETTGIDVTNGHRVIEIGCVEMLDRIKTNKKFHAYINPQRIIPESAIKIHGITNEYLRGKPLFADIAQEFLSFINGDTIVAHNAQFDISFLNYELSLLSLDKIDVENVIDTVAVAKQLFPGSPSSLDALCKRFSISTAMRDKHGALLDAELLADVYLELMGGSQLSIELGDNMSLSDVHNPVQRKHRNKRVFDVSREELEQHKRFIQDHIEGAIWNLYL